MATELSIEDIMTYYEQAIGNLAIENARLEAVVAGLTAQLEAPGQDEPSWEGESEDPIAIRDDEFEDELPNAGVPGTRPDQSREGDRYDEHG